MGKPQPQNFPPDGNPPPPPINPVYFDPRVYEILYKEFGLGQSNINIDIVSLTTGGTFAQLPLRAVRKAIIQNISDENVTISQGGPGTGVILVQYGALPTGNVNLSSLWFTRASAGVTLAVYSEG